MAKLSEDDALQVLRAALARPTRRARVGIGDDCAVLRPSSGAPVWTIDACQEGVHFRFDWMSLADVAWRSLNAAVSDVAAMGARPVGALCHLTLSARLTRRSLATFARAQAEAAGELGCPILGGNLTAGERFEVITTVLGELGTSSPLTRSGARPGEEIWLVGSIGRSRAGLLCLERGLRPTGSLRTCVETFRRPRALVAWAPRLIGRASSCLDISDGLARDAGHLARESGVCLVLRADALLGDDLLQVAAADLGEDPLELALQGGEDYALLATGPRERRPRGVRVIGTVEAGQGIWVGNAAGRVPVRGGFVHRV